MSQGRVAVAMSGGVDSATAAALLREQGYQVVGIAMRLSASLGGVDSARQACQVLDIPFLVLDFEAPFQELVMQPFCQEYGQGRTPNPCVRCNQLVKFGLLLERVLALGFDFIATGHYARIEEKNGQFHLLKAADPAKDQSYFLYALGQKELARTLMPVGSWRKEEVRQKARQLGLPLWDRSESQEICFVPAGGLRRFLSEHVPTGPGPTVTTGGQQLGRHDGVPLYTVGQRRHLGVGGGGPWYVVRIDAATNTLVVGREAELYCQRLRAVELNFVSGSAPNTPIRIAARVRYRSPEASATLILRGQEADVAFDEPQRAIAPGQAVVLYHGQEVLGGGIIETTL